MDKPTSNSRHKKKSITRGSMNYARSKETAIGDVIIEEPPVYKVPSKIYDGDIHLFSVNPDTLIELRKSLSKPKWKVDQMKAVYVKKLKPLEQNRNCTVSVLKPVPYTMTVDNTVFMGSKYNITGRLHTHNLLEATEKEELQVLKRRNYPVPELRTNPLVSQKQELSRMRKNSRRRHRFSSRQALMTWDNQMQWRRKQQQCLSSKLSRPVDELLMARAYTYYHTQHEKCLLAQALYALDNVIGKPAQALRHMWQQQERIGDEFTGIHMSYTTTEKIGPQTLEAVGFPVSTSRNNVKHRLSDGMHIWENSQCVQGRKEVRSMLHTLYPYTPVFSGLEVVGQTYKPPIVLTEGKDEKPRPVISTASVYRIPSGPSLRINGLSALWAGNYTLMGCVDLHIAVLFDGPMKKQLSQYLDIFNNGSTVIHFDWIKMNKSNSFSVQHQKKRTFYFSTESGVILPGEGVKVLVNLKSNKPGLFMERWKLQTRPVLLGGADIVITLKGLIHPVLDYRQIWSNMEESLLHKQAENAVRQVLLNILMVACREKRLPVFSPPTIMPLNDQFTAANPGLYYHSAVVQDLEDLHLVVSPSLESVPWDFSVIELKTRICQLDSDEKKEQHLERLNQATMELSYLPHTPVTPSTHHIRCDIVYSLLSKAVDNFCSLAFTLGHKIDTELSVTSTKQDPQDNAVMIEELVEQMKKKKAPRRKSMALKPKTKECEHQQAMPVPKSISPRQKKWQHAVYQVMGGSSNSDTCKIRAKLQEKLYLQTYMLLRNIVDDISQALEGTGEDHTQM